jgi:hypothetical protein
VDDHVPEHDEPISARLDPHAHVARRRNGAYAGGDESLRVDEIDQTGFDQRQHLLTQMRALGDRLLGREEAPVVAVDDVTRIRKSPVPAHVVDVQVRVHDEIDLLDVHEGLRKLARQMCLRVGHECTRLRSEACVDEDRRFGTTNEDRVDR